MIPKILIIDDDPTSLATLSSILSKKGFNTIQSHSGQDAFAKLRLSKPNVIICDINMPGMDGVDVFTKLKEIDETSKIPFFVTSSHVHMEKNFLAVGATGFIKKPFDTQELTQQIQESIDNEI